MVGKQLGNFKSAKQDCVHVNLGNLHTARDTTSKNEFALYSNRNLVINLGGLTKRSENKSRTNYLTDHNHKETANFVNNFIEKKR